MNSKMRIFSSLVFSLLAALSQAQTNPYQKGPDPTAATFTSTAGPFATASVAVSALSVVGFGGGTIVYPTATGTYAAITVVSGFTGSDKDWIPQATLLASHGFVVMAVNTFTPYDFPDSRATQVMAAMNYLTNSSSTTVRSRIDKTRRGIMGHSMGGGGVLIAARDNPTLKSVVPLSPWNMNDGFSSVAVPAIILVGQNDTTAPPSSMALSFYNALPASLKKEYGELIGGDHLVTAAFGTPVKRYVLSWTKRFLDNDTRYSTFLCGADHTSYAPTVFSRYFSTCPF